MKATMKKIAWNVGSYGASIAIAYGIILGLTKGYDCLPRLWGVLFRSVRVESETVEKRGSDEACFAFANLKLKPGYPVQYLMYVEGENSPKLPIKLRLVDKDLRKIETREGWKEHDVGERWSSYYCFDYPGTVTAQDELEATGTSEHRRWFGTIRSELPSFTICPVGEVLDDASRPLGYRCKVPKS